MSLNFYWSKQWYELFTSCNVFCMQAWHFRKFPNQSQFMLSLPLYLQSIHDKEFKRNLHTVGSCWSECSLVIHSMFSILCLTVNVHHKEPQQVMDFSLFLLALYLLWDNFLISEMTSIHVNNTAKKTPCQPQSVHSLGMLRAENATLPQLCDFWLRTRYKWDTRFFGGILRNVDW